VLAEINIMSKIVRVVVCQRCELRETVHAQTSVRMKLICVQVLNEMLGGSIDVTFSAVCPCGV